MKPKKFTAAGAPSVTIDVLKDLTGSPLDVRGVERLRLLATAVIPGRYSFQVLIVGIVSLSFSCSSLISLINSIEDGV